MYAYQISDQLLTQSQYSVSGAGHRLAFHYANRVFAAHWRPPFLIVPEKIANVIVVAENLIILCSGLGFGAGLMLVVWLRHWARRRSGDLAR